MKTEKANKDLTKQLTKLSMAVTAFLMCTQVFAAPGKVANETNKVVREAHEKTEKQRPEVIKNFKAIFKAMTSMGAVDASELASAMRQKMSITEGDKNFSVDPLQIANVTTEAHKKLKELETKKNELDKSEQELLDIKLKIAEKTPEFLSLAKDFENKESDEAKAYIKHLSLMGEVLGSYGKDEALSHLKVMEATLAEKTDASVKADTAYARGLVKLYGKETLAKKLQEILGCARG